jgi:hypothetical protein
MRASIICLFRSNRIYIWSALSITIIMLALFKLIYPYPNMVLDSYYYILAAISHSDVNAWAIGYSWFLRLFGIFSHSPLLVVIFQYLFLEASLLLFFLVLTRVFHFSTIAKLVFFVFLFVNPLFLYCANFIMADSLFIALSILWVSLLLCICVWPNIYFLWIHAVLILFVFVVRYNALYYPLVASVALLVSRYSIRQKVLGIVLQTVFIGGFILYTCLRVGALSGQVQFSPFGNWKTANDALYMYGHIYRERNDPVPKEFAALHETVRHYFESGAQVDDLLNYQSPFYGSEYMFFDTSPLVRYKNLHFGADTEFLNFKKMAYVGPLYGAYGTYLIQKYPGAFLHYFVGPNAVRYFFPPMEAFASLPPFFLRSDYLGQAGRTWFGIRTLTVSWSAIQLRTYLLSPYPMAATFVHLLFVLNIAGLFWVRSLRSLSQLEQSALIVLVALWICDFVFNLTAAATVMRYIIFSLIIEFGLVVWLTEQIYATRDGTKKH